MRGQAGGLRVDAASALPGHITQGETLASLHLEGLPWKTVPHGDNAGPPHTTLRTVTGAQRGPKDDDDHQV